MTISKGDITCIIDWLDGKFKEGSSADVKARRALANALRYEPRDHGLMFTLADLIDPDRREDVDLWLVFKRARGNRSKRINWRRVAAIIWHETRAGKKPKAAVSIAMETCGVKSRDKALKAYKYWEPMFERCGSQLKSLTRITD